MSGPPVEIHWFPASGDRFLTWGSEINLYQVRCTDDIDHRVATSKIVSINYLFVSTIFIFRLFLFQT